jgi:glucose dehydrogenase/plastocyanin
MTRQHGFVRAFLVGLVALFVVLTAARHDGGNHALAQGGVPAIPPEVTSNAAQWPMANRDYANTRATTDSTITSQTVSQLGVAWTFAIPGVSVFGGAATNPLIAGDTVYLQDLKSNVFAIDLQSGQVKWQQNYGADSIGPNGPAIGYGKLFIAKDTATIAALDLNSGAELWSTPITRGPGEGVDIQLSVFDGLVLGSTVPGSGAASFYQGGNTGVLFALDQQTGAVKWKLDTVDTPDIWGNAQVNSGGGAWYPPAIDIDNGMTYWGIGNPAPFPGTADFPNGSSRQGPNLYTDSLLAVDHTTGTMKWYRQILPHDLFDHDFQSSPILTTVAVNGAGRKVAIGSGKLGRVVAMDALTGDVYWNVAVGRHQNDEIAAIPNGMSVEVYPGLLGGVETPMAYADGVVYVPVVNLSAFMTNTSLDARTANDVTRSTGELVAIDAATGIVLWDHQFPIADFGGATVVNDLLFTSTIDGTVYALDRQTGDTVWQWKAPTGVNATPAVVGDTILIPAGVGQSPVMVALKLGAAGTVASPPAGAPQPTAAPAAGSTTLQISSLEDSTFDTDTLTAPANTRVTVNYLNDTAIPHNIHFYNGPDDTAPTLATTDVETGPGNMQTVTFTTPGPGSYFFRCDVHPIQMVGTLVVTSSP